MQAVGELGALGALRIVIKALERVMPKKTDAPPPAPPADVVLLTEIRDLLKQQR